jgi:hypothetical protein
VGDPLLTIHRKTTCRLTSIVIPGQAANMVRSSLRQQRAATVNSFTHEILAGGGTADYSWTSMKPEPICITAARIRSAGSDGAVWWREKDFAAGSLSRRDLQQ